MMEEGQTEPKQIAQVQKGGGGQSNESLKDGRKKGQYCTYIFLRFFTLPSAELLHQVDRIWFVHFTPTWVILLCFPTNPNPKSPILPRSSKSGEKSRMTIGGSC
jgi:hypothetical protein